MGQAFAGLEQVVEGEAAGAEDGDEWEDGELTGVALAARRRWRRWS